MKFFETLENAGGFYYERWGDAPVHSIGAALLAPKDKLHFFHEIGYRHEPFQHCPVAESHTRGKCWCDPQLDNFGRPQHYLVYPTTSLNFKFFLKIDYHWYSCMPKYDRLFE